MNNATATATFTQIGMKVMTQVHTPEGKLVYLLPADLTSLQRHRAANLLAESGPDAVQAYLRQVAANK